MSPHQERKSGVSNQIPQSLGHWTKVPVWFYSTQIGKTETHRDGWKQGRKAESTKSSHTAGVIVVHGDLLCRQTKQTLPVKKLTASTAITGPLPISPAFPPSSIHLWWCQPPEFLPHSTTAPPGKEQHWQPAQASAAAWVKNASLDLCIWSPLSCTHSGLAPPVVQLHTTSLTPATSVHAQGETMQSQESMLTARVPVVGLSPCHCPGTCCWPPHQVCGHHQLQPPLLPSVVSSH